VKAVKAVAVVPGSCRTLEFGESGAGGDGADKDKDEKWEKFIQELKRITPWKMKDLTIPSYVKLARKLVAEKKLWKHFADIM
jgi:hypothetical protein